MAGETFNEIVYKAAATYIGAGATAANPNANPSAVYSGQATVNNSAAALGSQILINGATVKNDPDSAVNIFVGGSGVTSSTGFKLKPGESVSVPAANVSNIYVITASGTSTAYWLAN